MDLWRDNFEMILTSTKGRELLMQYLRSVEEKAVWLLEFWVEVEKFKKTNQNGEKIVPTFLAVMAPKKIDIEAELRGELQMGEDEPNSENFSRCQLSAVRQLKQKYHQNFIKSDVFQQYFNSL